MANRHWMADLRRATVLFAACGLAFGAMAQVQIESISGARQGGHEMVRIDFDQPVSVLPKGFVVQSPARIALDFPGTVNAMGVDLVEINQGNLLDAQVAQTAERARVVIGLQRPTSYEAVARGNSVFITLAETSYASTPAPEQSVFAESRNSNTLPLHDVDFRRGIDSAGRIVVGLANDQVGVDIERQGNSLVVDFLNTSLPEGLRRQLDVSDFGTPVQTIRTVENGDRVRMTVAAVGQWEHSAYQSDNQLVLEISQLANDPDKLTKGPGFHGEKLSLNFQDIDVRSLLQVIADFTDFNIVTSDSVQGSLTLRLKDVPWDQALNIILEAKDLGMRRQGNVLRIAPKEEMAAKEKAELEAQAAIRELEPVRTESFQLNYTKAEELKDQILDKGGSGGSGSSTNGMLSSRGSVVAEPRTNQLFISDVPSRLEQIREMIAKLDIPVRQVLIEARIVEANDTFGKSLGVRLGGADLRGVRGGDAGYSVGNGHRVALGGNYNAITSTTGQTDAAGLTTASSQFLNLAADTSTIAPGVSPANFAISLFSSAANRFLNLELSALEADGRGRIVSSPHVVTADQTKALIEQGTEFAYQEATSSGATAVSFRKAVLKLEVIPQITPEGNIILDLDVNKDSPGEIIEGNVSINTKRVNTQVLVENGGTVVIGGIFEITETESENKVPLLGDIPVMGNLFKQRTNASTKQEMLVFITPKVITDRGSIR